MSETPAYNASRGSVSERRLHARHRVSSLIYADVGSDNGGIVVDLNEEGMSLQAVVPLTKNTDINLRVQLPNSRSTFETGAQIIWVGESQRLAGLRFRDLSLAARTLIRDWIQAEISPKLSVEQSLGLAPGPGNVPQGTQTGPKTSLESPKSRWQGSVAEFKLPPPRDERAFGSMHGLEKSRRTPTLSELSARAQPASADASLKNPDTTSDYGIQREAVPFRALEEARKLRGNSNDDILSEDRLTRPRAAATAQETSIDGLSSPLRELLASSASVAQSSLQLRSVPSSTDGSLTESELASNSSKPSVLQAMALSVAARIDRGPGVKRSAAAAVLLIIAIIGGGIWMTIGSPSTHTDFSSLPAGPASDAVGTVVEPTDGLIPAATEITSNGQNKNDSVAGSRNVAQSSGGPIGTSPAPVRQAHEEASFALIPENRPPENHVQSQEAALAPAPAVESVAVAPQSMAALTGTKTVDGSLQPPQAAEDSQPPRIVAGHVLRPTDRFNPAHLTYRVEPVYPTEAQQQGIEGTVKIHQVITADGNVRSVKLVSGPAQLTAAAMDAAQHWRYLPALLNGQPIETEQDVTIDFRLAR